MLFGPYPDDSVRMGPPGAAHSAGTWFSRSGGPFIGACTRGENRKLPRKLRGPAVRALGSLPIVRADKNLAVLPALPALKFVNRHPAKYRGTRKSSSMAGAQKWLRPRP